MRIVTVVGIIALLAGCASSRAAAPGAQTYVGEVWTWDKKDSIVTIMQDGGRLVRVKVDPETMRTLQLHQYTRVTGVPAGPAELVQTTQPAGAYNAVPKGQAEMIEVAGTVSTVDPKGRLAEGRAGDGAYQRPAGRSDAGHHPEHADAGPGRHAVGVADERAG
jgi:hypothetical protein